MTTSRTAYTVLRIYDVTCSGWDVQPCRMTLGFSYFPRPRPARDRHSANQNLCMSGGKSPSVVVISASELDGFHDMSLFLLGETRI